MCEDTSHDPGVRKSRNEILRACDFPAYCPACISSALAELQTRQADDVAEFYRTPSGVILVWSASGIWMSLQEYCQRELASCDKCNQPK